MTEENKKSRTELLERRAELMRWYLERHEDFKNRQNTVAVK